MRVQIYSEIGPLEQVVIHTPGNEIVRMTQHELDRLLFDDLLSPPAAKVEHQILAEILEGCGAEVLQLSDLLERALRNAPRAAVDQLLGIVAELSGFTDLADRLQSLQPKALAQALIAGVSFDALDQHAGGTSLARLRGRSSATPDFALWPVPNLMFMRDPCISVFDGVVQGRMATRARARESWLVAFALSHSGVDDDVPLKLYFAEDDRHREQRFRSVEGGDVLVLSEQALMIGCSERTSAQTIERLASEALFVGAEKLERVYAVMMPEERSVMHLDTILTQIDQQLFLGHQPLIAPETPGTGLKVACLERGKPPRLLDGQSVLSVLEAEFGPEVELVPCGGDDPLYQEREQWTDGANAICLAPGKIILYSRNVRTIEALADRGFEEVKISAVLPKDLRRTLIAAGMQKPRTVFSFSGSELSRARGGGRCLTMPIRRAV